MPLTPYAASSTPDAASSAVSGLGTRRVHMSMAAPVPAPAATVARTIRSDGLGNVLPEHVENLVAESGDTDHRDDRDQCGEESVLHEVLAFVPKRQSADCRQHVDHGFASSFKNARGGVASAPRDRHRIKDLRTAYAAGASAAAMLVKMV